jgi:membrane-associated phospholipid phosphatase
MSGAPVRERRNDVRACVIAAGAAVAVLVVVGVLAARRPLPAWDHDAVRRALDLSSRYDLVLRVVMQLGTTAVAIVLGVLTLVVQHSIRRGATVVVAALVGRELAVVAKAVWSRPRPAVAYHDLAPRLFESGHGFPSGHATVAAAVLVAIGAGASRRWWPILAVLGLGVAFARVYFGVHFVLDVIGGLALGAVVGFVAVAVERGVARRVA